VLSGRQAAYQWNLPTPVTRVAAEIHDLHLIMMWIILAIFAGVFGVMFIDLRPPQIRRPQGEQFTRTSPSNHLGHHPVLILIAVAWPATKSILKL
jgi:cytochrome c oxidase subunit 2